MKTPSMARKTERASRGLREQRRDEEEEEEEGEVGGR
jgi:hypothetical protein